MRGIDIAKTETDGAQNLGTTTKQHSMSEVEIPEHIQRQAHAILSRSPVFLDTETSGLRTTDEIAEIAIIDTDGSILLDSLVRTMRPMEKEAIAVHGITNEELLNWPGWSEVGEHVSDILRNRVVVAHCASFDAGMIVQTASMAGIKAPQAAGYCCTMKLLLPLTPGKERLPLTQAMRLTGVTDQGLPGKPHRAAYDAMCCRRVLFAAAGLALAI